MADRPRFIIGLGERLTEPISGPRRPFEAVTPYDPDTARERLARDVDVAIAAAAQLPDKACPDDRVVTVLTLHPSFLAKSYYPGVLLAAAGFDPVGSRPTQVTPASAARRTSSGVVERYAPDAPRPTTDLFVETTRQNLRRWRNRLTSDSPFDDDREAQDIIKIEALRLPNRNERLRVQQRPGRRRQALEVVLHSDDPSVVRGFEAFAGDLEVEVLTARRISAGGMCFVPVSAPSTSLRQLADFSFVRAIRAAPRLRQMNPAQPVVRSIGTHRATLPADGPLDPNLRVAVFDGGLPNGSCLSPWVDAWEFPSMGAAVPEFLEHGQQVSSALLFGHVDPAEPLPRPYSYVDHYRVLDDTTANDPWEMYDVIDRIGDVLSQSSYEFVSLSIGPDLAIEDDEVHVWTAFWDEVLSKGDMIASFAIGNNGERDRASGNARIQVPADSVNAIAVGAADRPDATWGRAAYSAVGPGRSPGLIKPDLLNFGGSIASPFLVVSEAGTIDGTGGTSFAAPATMRTALGVRATFGSRVTPLAARALLIHTTEAHSTLDRDECGWGRCALSLDDVIVCGDGEARVLYQGELAPGKYLRARVPVPPSLPKGMVEIAATLVYATETDPQDPGNYTRAGVEVTFRPHAERLQPDSSKPKTRPMFGRSGYVKEADLRSDAHKWETVLHDSTRMQSSGLSAPVFEIHYNARDSGRDGTSSAPKIHYAMVITVRMKKCPNLYEEVLASYTLLEALTPVTIPVAVAT